MLKYTPILLASSDPYLFDCTLCSHFFPLTEQEHYAHFSYDGCAPLHTPAAIRYEGGAHVAAGGVAGKAGAGLEAGYGLFWHF